MRIAESSDRLGFLPKPEGRARALQNLHSDVAIEIAIARPIDFAKPTCAKQALDLVVARETGSLREAHDSSPQGLWIGPTILRNISHACGPQQLPESGSAYRNDRAREVAMWQCGSTLGTREGMRKTRRLHTGSGALLDEKLDDGLVLDGSGLKVVPRLDARQVRDEPRSRRARAWLGGLLRLDRRCSHAEQQDEHRDDKL